MLKPQSSSANPCNEEEVRYFMLPCYSLAESILPSGTKSEDLRHCKELKKKKKGPAWVSLHLDEPLGFITIQILREMLNLLSLDLNVFCLSLIEGDSRMLSQGTLFYIAKTGMTLSVLISTGDK